MNHEFYMNFAIELAKHSKSQAHPNPSVGCVIQRNDKILGYGSHLIYGGKHAEIIALEMANFDVQGADLYVSMEPCSHYGKTPPCVDSIIKHGIKRVFIASFNDPNPKVNGNGIKKLKENNIEVIEGFLNENIESLNKLYNHNKIKSRPYITLKSAISIDGKIATTEGESKWISNEKSRHDVHLIRNSVDAILTSSNTIIKDNPNFTTRLPNQNSKNSKLIIIDRFLKVDYQNSNIINNDLDIIVFTLKSISKNEYQTYKKKNIEVISSPDSNLDFHKIFTYLSNIGIQSMLIEAGGSINSLLLHDNLIDEIVLYVAPKIIGGLSQYEVFSQVSTSYMRDIINLQNVKFEQLDDNLKIIATLNS